jgi:transcriptional regulator with XRE-family HTH domain
MPYVESIALKSHRKRVGLIQEDMAVLIGVQSASQVSRHESSEREPDLRTAIAYSIVFDVSLRELLPKLHREIAGEVNARATKLISEVGSSKDILHQSYRLEALRRVTARIEMYEFSA